MRPVIGENGLFTFLSKSRRESSKNIRKLLIQSLTTKVQLARPTIIPPARHQGTEIEVVRHDLQEHVDVAT